MSIIDQLGADFVYRKQMKWPLILETNWKNYSDHYNKPHDFLEISNDINGTSFDLDKFKNKFTLMQPILELNKGKILVAGGFYTTENYKRCKMQDIDFFIHSCNEYEATQILKDSITFIISNAFKQEYIPKEMNISKVINITIEHSLNVINVIIYYDLTYKIDSLKYQFILRLYPRADMVLGGFDLACSMVGYDGENIFATPIGAYSLVNRKVIIDISRRSTTFARRLDKYRNRGFSFIFPGFPKDVNFDPNEKKLAIKQIQEIANKFNLVFKAYTFEYDYDSRSSMPERLTLSKGFIKKHDVDFLDFTIDVRKTPYLSKNLKNLKHEDKLVVDYDIIGSECPDISNLMYIMNGKSEYAFTTIKINSNKIYSQSDINNLWNSFINESVLDVKKILKKYPVDKRHKFVNYGVFSQQINSDNFKEIYEKACQHREFGIKSASEALKGLKWITKNPGRQWTSSVNPAIVTGKEFYGDKYRRVCVILSEEVETTLRLGRKTKESVLSWLPRDIFNLIIMKIPFV